MRRDTTWTVKTSQRPGKDSLEGSTPKGHSQSAVLKNQKLCSLPDSFFHSLPQSASILVTFFYTWSSVPVWAMSEPSLCMSCLTYTNPKEGLRVSSLSAKGGSRLALCSFPCDTVISAQLPELLNANAAWFRSFWLPLLSRPFLGSEELVAWAKDCLCQAFLVSSCVLGLGPLPVTLAQM